MPRRRLRRHHPGAALALVLLLLAGVATSLAAGTASAQLTQEQQRALGTVIETRTAEIERAAAARLRAATAPETATETAETAAGTPAPTGDTAAAPTGTDAPARVDPGGEPGGDPVIADLTQVLRNPEARRALIAALEATGGTTPQAPEQGSARADAGGAGTARDATPPPGPGVGPGTGLTRLAAGAVSALSRSSPAASGSGETAPSASSETAPDGGTTPAAAPDAAAGAEAASAPAEAASDAPAAEPVLPIPAPDISVLTGLVQEFYQDAVWASGITTQVPQLLDWLAIQFDDDMRGVWLNLAVQIGLVVLAGLAAAALARLAVGGPARRLQEKAEDTAASRRLVLLLTRLVLRLLPIALFAAAAQATMPLIDAELRTELVAAVIVTSLVSLRAATVVLHALLAPRRPALRLVPVSDETARLLYRGFWRAALVLMLGYMTVEVARLLGMPPGGRDLLTHVIGLIVLIVTVHTLIALRGVGKRAIRRITLGSSASAAWVNGLLRGLADIWHLLAAAYAIGIFFAWVIDAERWFALAGWATVKTLVVFFLSLLVFGWIQRVRDAGMMRLHAATSLDRAARQRVRHYLGLATTAARVLLLAGALALILTAWHLDVVAWLSSGVAQRILSIGFNVALVLAVSVALWEGVNHLIQRYLSSTDRDGAPVERGQRERTLLPLLRNVLSVFLVVVVSLILLSELGLDIAPLLAGAGVVGLAIGFGSQKLVQDVISGVFNLLEDTIAVGDVVQVGGHAGVVEAMSIRSLRLRDLSGNLHTIPFSGVDTVTNMTKDFSYYLFEVGVAYRENTDHVTAVLQEIGDELRQDAEYGPSILEPLEVLGVDGFRDSAVIIKARIMTKPIMQWWVGREFNRRMKHRFDALGIEIPFPHMTLYFGVDKEGNAPPGHLHVDRLAAMGQRAAAGGAPASAPGSGGSSQAAPLPSGDTPAPAWLPDPSSDGGTDGGTDGGR
ncbi:mechanosensitive ion channel family protein [Roseospira goensis]|nr:mechanosensitive ion channel domain-containing protein [Roseospira goensis]